MINREEFEMLPEIMAHLHNVSFVDECNEYIPLKIGYVIHEFSAYYLNGAWYAFQEIHKQNAALKVLLGMSEAQKQALITMHEAEKTMIIHAKKINDGECVVPSGTVDHGYCINTKTGEARYSIKDFLKNNKPKNKGSVMDKAVDMARTYGAAFVQLKLNAAHEIEYKNISSENVILRKTEG